MRIAINTSPCHDGLAGNDVKRAVFRLFTLPERLFAFLVGWQARMQQRYRLAEMTSERLDDMGIDAAQAAAEAAKPFWRM